MALDDPKKVAELARMTARLQELTNLIENATREAATLREQITGLVAGEEYAPMPEVRFDTQRALALLTDENKKLLRYLRECGEANRAPEFDFVAGLIYGDDSVKARNRISARLAFLAKHGLVLKVGDRWVVHATNFRQMEAAIGAATREEQATKKS